MRRQAAKKPKAGKGHEMAGFSFQAERVIEAFAAGMGLVAHAAPDRSYGFEFDRSGTLSLVPSDDGGRIIICLARMPGHADDALRTRLLEAAGFDQSVGATVHAALAPDGAFVFAVNVDESDFELPLLHKALSRLIEIHDSLLQ